MGPGMGPPGGPMGVGMGPLGGPMGGQMMGPPGSPMGPGAVGGPGGSIQQQPRSRIDPDLMPNPVSGGEEAATILCAVYMCTVYA